MSVHEVKVVYLGWFKLDSTLNQFILQMNKENIITLTPTWEERRCRQASVNQGGERKSVEWIMLLPLAVWGYNDHN